MSDIPPIDGRARLFAPAAVRAAEEHGSSASAAAVDRVEISETGQILAMLDNPSEIRGEKVASLREAIQSGTYETSDKIDATIDRLLQVLSTAP